MERAAALVFLAGCGFQITTGSAIDDAKPSDGSASMDGGGDDAPLPIDGMLPDQPVMKVEECDVVRVGGAANATLLGGTGNRGGDVTCPDDKVGVGLQFDVTPVGITNHNNQILLTTIRLWCGTIERTSSNQMVTSELEVSSYTALQGSTQTACAMYMPPTQLGQVMCPDGSVLAAILGHQVDSTLYNNVTIRCAAVGTDGQVTTSFVDIAMPGTGTNTTMPEQTQCPASTAITAIHATSGCGQDGATAACTATLCETD